MPADPRDLLLAEMVVQMGFAKREIVDLCLAGLEKEGFRRDLKQALLDGNHVSPAKMALVEKFMDREPPAASAAAADEDRDFGRLVEMKKLAAGGDVDQAGKLLEEMKGRGAYAKLGGILMRKTVLAASEMQQVLAEKGITVLRCKSCGSKAELQGFDPAKPCACPSCLGPMTPVELASAPSADAGMDVVVSEEPPPGPAAQA